MTLTSRNGTGSIAGDWPAGYLTAADQERFRRYADHRAFFDGAQWAGRARPGETRLTFNYARVLLRKVAAYVFPAPVVFSVANEGEDGAANRAERLLNDFVMAAGLSALDTELSIEAAVLGDAALKVSWDAADRMPVVAAVDPATLLVWTAPDRPRQIERVAQRYGLPGSALPALTGDATGGALDPHRIYPVVEAWTAGNWLIMINGQVARDEPNPYGWIPYVIAANNPRPHEFWGSSDLEDLVDVCTELNQRMSVLSQVLQLSGAPIAVLENVDGSEGITVGPGAKWELPRDSKAYLLDLLSSGGINLHIEYVQLLYRALHDLSETPRTAFGDSGRTLSGAALEVEIQPLVQKVARKRREWEAVYQGRNFRLLDLLERFGGEHIGGLRRTQAIWPDVLPSDRETSVRNAVAMVGAGIQSRRSAIASLGGTDPDQELSQIQSELPPAQISNARA